MMYAAKVPWEDLESQRDIEDVGNARLRMENVRE